MKTYTKAQLKKILDNHKNGCQMQGGREPTFAQPTFAMPTLAMPTFAMPTLAIPTFAMPLATAVLVG